MQIGINQTVVYHFFMPSVAAILFPGECITALQLASYVTILTVVFLIQAKSVKIPNIFSCLHILCTCLHS